MLPLKRAKARAINGDDDEEGTHVIHDSTFRICRSYETQYVREHIREYLCKRHYVLTMNNVGTLRSER